MSEIKFVSVQSPSSGTLVNNGDGSITYTPPADFQGAVRFEYTIADDYRTATGFCYIAIYPPLVAGDLVFRTGENAPITLQTEDFLTNHSGVVEEPVFSGEPDVVVPAGG